MLYVSDVVDFVKTALKKQESNYELVNIGSGVSASIKNLAKKIVEISGKNLEIEFDESQPTIKTDICLDYSKARARFGWEPKVSLDDGIKMTLDWYKKNVVDK